VKFNRADDIETEVWSMRLADQKRAQRRALIDDLFNGLPPYSDAEVSQNNIKVNSSNLIATRIHADATNQCKNALLSTNEYFSVKIDVGPAHRRAEWSEIITAELRKAMKEGKSALRYVEKQKNVASSLILHGAGPTNWSESDRWCGSMQGMEDVLIPSRTLLSMENLEHFAIYRRYTPAQLARYIAGPNVDRGWRKDVVQKAIEWAKKQGTGSDATDYANGYTPERLAEDVKENGGIWSTDQVATINAYDFYFTDSESDTFGWRRRIVLDSPDLAGINMSTGAVPTTGSQKNILDSRGGFLYDSGDRPFGSTLSEILHFQFADGSVVAPHRYHSIRGIGFLLYSVCELSNRLYSKMNESAFETLMQYFRGNGNADVERVVKLDLIDKGLIPEGIQFVPPDQRWQVNQALVTQVMNMNKELISDSSTGYKSTYGNDVNGPEKTATQITAEVNASTALVSSMLQDLYLYAKYEYREIARRFCLKDSRDADVKKFRAGCIKRGVPEDVLDPEAWEISVERIMGNGNRQLAIAQAQLEMSVIDRLDPDAQRKVLRGFFFAISGDAARTNDLIPFKPQTVTDSTHDAELSAARMLMGLLMGLKQNVNHGEYAAILLASMKQRVDQIKQRGTPATSDEVQGLQICAGQTIDGQPIQTPTGPGNGAASHISILAQNPTDKGEVKALGDALGNVMNEVKGLAQQAQEAMQAQQGQQGQQIDPATQAKVAGDLMKAQATIKIKQQAHDQKTAQRAQTHQQRLEQQRASDELKNAAKLRDVQVQESATDLKTAAEIRRQAQQPVGVGDES